jgi:RNA polymerase sigma-70 factor (ECF subfamily)
MENKDYLKLLREGSSIAFEKLYNQYSGKLYHFILKITNGNTYLTEELVQRAFVKVWETHERINPEKTFISYLCTIAKNMLLNELEHQTIEYIYQEYFKRTELFSDFSADKELNYNSLEEIINKLTEQLPPARRQIFKLSHKGELSIKEIAQQLGLAETTVQTQLTSALRFMREQLSRHYEYIVIGFIYVLNKCNSFF